MFTTKTQNSTQFLGPAIGMIVNNLLVVITVYSINTDEITAIELKTIKC